MAELRLMALIRPHRKLQMLNHACLNTLMGRWSSLKPGTDILIQNQASVYQLEIYFMVQKDTWNFMVRMPVPGKLSGEGKKLHLQDQRKKKMKRQIPRLQKHHPEQNIGSILLMQFVQVKMRP